MFVSVSASLLKQLLVRSFVVCFIKILLVLSLTLYIFILILSIFVVIHPSNKTRAIWGSAENVAIKRQLKNFGCGCYIHREQINARPSHGNVNFNSLRKGFKKKNPKSKAEQWDHRLDPASVSFLKTTRHVAPCVWPFTCLYALPTPHRHALDEMMDALLGYLLTELD